MRTKQKIVELHKLVEPIFTCLLKKAPGLPEGKPGVLLAFTKAAKEGIII